jgi:putative heme iron utilization protein
MPDAADRANDDPERDRDRDRDDDALALRRLLDTQPVAALGTLHRGEPAVSMVPFVVDPAAGTLLIHVSGLATHTQDLERHPRASLMVMAGPDAAVSPQALPRVTLQCDAATLPRDDEAAERAYAAAAALYLARFPDAAMMFELGDFRLVALRPASARLVAGFGRARSLVGAALAAWMRG